jgi:type IV secretory pathway VirB10-like protein
LAPHGRETSPYVNRIRLLWQAMRQPVIDRFPDAPGLPQDVKAYLKRVNDVYVTDAYHSLSIEGYQVTPELIERVRTGSWNPERNDSDREQRNAMAARHDAEERQRQQELAAAMQQLQQDQGVPTTEAGNTPPMTLAQRSAIYGESPNAPQHTSNVSEAQAEAKQKRLSIEKQQQDALNSDTVAIDFSHTGTAATPVAVQAARAEGAEKESAEEIGGKQAPKDGAAKAEPISAYPFDQFQGQLYRVFEGTVLEGVLTNHVDGGLSGPILVMLTTDYYSHDHQQLLMPQGTRLIGSVQSVGNA